MGSKMRNDDPNFPAGTPCLVCGHSTARGAAMCSRSCGAKWGSLNRSPEEEAKRRAKIAVGMQAVRATNPNPMEDPAARAKMTATLRAIGHKPSVRGGNGQGMSEPQRLLLEALGDGWAAEYVVPSGTGARAAGVPNHYKIDIANTALRVAIEVDGESHRLLARQEADRRKDAWLQSKGWTVFRFRNAAVLANVNAVVATVTDVPRGLMA